MIEHQTRQDDIFYELVEAVRNLMNTVVSERFEAINSGDIDLIRACQNVNKILERVQS